MNFFVCFFQCAISEFMVHKFIQERPIQNNFKSDWTHYIQSGAIRFFFYCQHYQVATAQLLLIGVKGQHCGEPRRTAVFKSTHFQVQLAAVARWFHRN